MASHGMSSIFQIPTRCYTMFYMVHIILMITACTGLWNITLRCLGSPALHGLDPTSRNGLECPCIQPSQGQTDSLGLQTSGNSKGLLHLKKNKHLHIFQSKCPGTSAIYSMHRLQTNQGWKRWRLLAWPNKTIELLTLCWHTWERDLGWVAPINSRSCDFSPHKLDMSQRINLPCEARPPVVQTSCLASWINIHPKKKVFLKGLLPISENVAA